MRGAATANERSPSDDVVHATATEPDVADLTCSGGRCGRRLDEVRTNQPRESHNSVVAVHS